MVPFIAGKQLCRAWELSNPFQNSLHVSWMKQHFIYTIQRALDLPFQLFISRIFNLIIIKNNFIFNKEIILFLVGEKYFFETYEGKSYPAEYGERTSAWPAICGRKSLRISVRHKYLVIYYGGRTKQSENLLTAAYYNAKEYYWVGFCHKNLNLSTQEIKNFLFSLC